MPTNVEPFILRILCIDLEKKKKKKKGTERKKEVEEERKKGGEKKGALHPRAGILEAGIFLMAFILYVVLRKSDHFLVTCL